jgi:hypothetical protein
MLVVTVVCAGLSMLPAQEALAARVFYVSTSGSDMGSGSARRPFASIGRAVAIAAAGDTVLVRPGLYREEVQLRRSGAPGAPIVLRGSAGTILTSPDPSASLSAFDIGTGVSHIRIESFELTGGFAETVFVRPGAHHIELEGLEIHGNRNGIWIGGASHVSVRGCHIHHNRRAGVRVFASARRVWISETRSEHNDDGRGCSGDADGFSVDASASEVVLEEVSATGNSEDGFDLQAPNTTLLRAIARDHPCSGIKMANGGYIENTLVERANIGINVSASDATTTIAHATVSASNTGVRAFGPRHVVELRSSVVVGPGKALVYGEAVSLVERFNVFFRPELKERLIVRSGGSGETLYSGNDINGGRWQRESGQGVGTMARDPGLDVPDCRPLPQSVLVDSADPAWFPLVDLDGNRRPTNGLPDRGAYELVSATPVLEVRRVRAQPSRRTLVRLIVRADLRLPLALQSGLFAERMSLALRCGRTEIANLGVGTDAWSARGRSRQATVLAGASRLRAAAIARLDVQDDRLQLRLRVRDSRLFNCRANDAELRIAGTSWRSRAVLPVPALAREPQ